MSREADDYARVSLAQIDIAKTLWAKLAEHQLSSAEMLEAVVKWQAQFLNTIQRGTDGNDGEGTA